MIEIQKLTRDFENFLDVTEEARTNMERDQDYVDHKQWTAEEVDTLAQRGQAPVVINRIKTKVNLLKGIQKQRRTDPKALPRTPKHEDGADAVTDALRYVADNVDFQQTSSNGFEDLLVGYCAAITELSDDDEPEIQVNRIPWDRFYFDPHSRKKDFSDAKFMGIVLWMDYEDALDTFKGKAQELEMILNGTTDSVDGSTFDDRPTWIDRKRKRIRVCQHYFKKGGIWYETYFSKDIFLIEPKESPKRDEKGKPCNPIEAAAIYVDRENNRYGEVRAYIWIQDEINKRRSKLLHLLSVRQTKGEKGAVDDVSELKRQLARPDGHIEYERGMEFELLDTNDMSQGQFLLYQESKAEIDSIGANAALSGGESTDGMSGRALQALQQGGMAEVGDIFDVHKSWERRIYRQVWGRIKNTWTGEKWVRVTDDEDNLKWTGLNQPVTRRQMLEEAMQNGADNPAAEALLMSGDPRLNDVAEVRNPVAELDVDITITESPDYVTLRGEQFDTMAQLATAYGPEAVPFEVLVELSDMGHKDRVKELLKGDEDPQQKQAQAKIAGMQAEKQMEALTLANQKTRSEIGKNVADIQQKQIETQRLATQPADSVNVNT